MEIRCPCGQDHSFDPRWSIVREVVARFGEAIQITVEGKSWMVPRAWIIIHGIKGSELRELAERYGWTKCGAGGSNPS